MWLWNLNQVLCCVCYITVLKKLEFFPVKDIVSEISLQGSVINYHQLLVSALKKTYQSIPPKNIKVYYWTIKEQSGVNSKDWEQICLESNAAVFYVQ